MRWDLARGHIPRGFIGANRTLGAPYVSSRGPPCVKMTMPLPIFADWEFA